MTSVEPIDSNGDPTDEALVLRLATQDRGAFDELYRRHRDYARRVAIAVAGPAEADDVTADAFADVLVAIFERGNEVHNFRAYLSAAIRNTHLARTRHGARVQAASDRPWVFDESDDPDLVELVEPGHAVEALASLPEKWRELLWRVEVEGRSTSELAELMDMSPTAVSSMSHRARLALRRAFLDRHVPEARGAECRWPRARISQYVRGELSHRQSRLLERHVSGCAQCSQVIVDIESVNRRIGAAAWPIVIVASVGAGSFVDGTGLSSGAMSSGLVDPGGSGAAALPDRSSTAVKALVSSPKAMAVAAVATVAAAAVAFGAISTPTADSRAADPGPVAPPVMVEPRPAPLEPAPKPTDEPVVPAPRQPRPTPPPTAAPEETTPTPTTPRPPGPITEPEPTYDAGLTSLTKQAIGPSDWSLAADVTLTSSTSVAGTVVQVALSFDDEFGVSSVTGAGWTCREPTGVEVGVGVEYVFPAGTVLTCAQELTSTGLPSQLRLDVFAIASPTGSAQVSIPGRSDAKPGNDTASF